MEGCFESLFEGFFETDLIFFGMISLVPFERGFERDCCK